MAPSSRCRTSARCVTRTRSCTADDHQDTRAATASARRDRALSARVVATITRHGRRARAMTAAVDASRAWPRHTEQVDARSRDVLPSVGARSRSSTSTRRDVSIERERVRRRGGRAPRANTRSISLRERACASRTMRASVGENGACSWVARPTAPTLGVQVRPGAATSACGPIGAANRWSAAARASARCARSAGRRGDAEQVFEVVEVHVDRRTETPARSAISWAVGRRWPSTRRSRSASAIASRVFADRATARRPVPRAASPASHGRQMYGPLHRLCKICRLATGGYPRLSLDSGSSLRLRLATRREFATRSV